MAVAIREYNGIKYSNRQLYNWFFVLYPELNDSHNKAIDKLDLFDECIMMKHDNSINEESGEPLAVHYHVYLHYDSPKWLFTILKELELGDDSLHLFKSWDEIKRKKWKNPDDYIIYLTHLKEDDKPDKYDASLFQGGNRLHAIEVVQNIELTEQDRINKCINDIKELHEEKHLNLYYLHDIYFKLIEKGDGYIINKKWNFFKDFIRDLREGGL